MQKEKGITLISLAVTIIVIMILSGLSINLLIGDNGVIIRANNTNKQLETAQEIQRIQIDISNTIAKNNMSISQAQLENILVKYTTEINKDANEDIVSVTLLINGETIPIEKIFSGVAQEVIISQEYTQPITSEFAEQLTIIQGKTEKAQLKYSENIKSVTYTSSDNTIATVSGNNTNIAKITGIEAGQATITATIIDTKNQTITKTCSVTIQSAGVLADGSWNASKGINSPRLVQGLVPVTYNADGTVNELPVTNTNKLSETDFNSWCDYQNGNWANAITKGTITDSSTGQEKEIITGYWVWIPRYEYIINEYTDSTLKNGTTTVQFIPTSTTTVDNGYTYIHPAFRNGNKTQDQINAGEIPFGNGEWDKEISGFWIAKFPAGFQKNTITDNNGTLSETISNSTDTIVNSNQNYSQSDSTTIATGTTNAVGNTMSLPVFKPLTGAYNYICTGDCYTLAQQVSRSSNSLAFYGLSSSTSDSHMLKNSEWGAVAYLTQSQYGRNGTEPYHNNYSHNSATNKTMTNVYAVTGLYTNSTGTSSTGTITHAWYDSIGKLGSSTGNLTGVYDLNGCVKEYVAGYISNGNESLNTYKGNSNWVTTTSNSTGYSTLSIKYATVYPYGPSYSGGALSDSNINNRAAYYSLKSSTYGYGDAILETSSSGNGSDSWYVDFSYFPYENAPFFVRGGSYSSDGGGVFNFSHNSGVAYPEDGFRVALVVE